ncbi:xanthine dehydrogenase family protein molybdopterin-binding subunit [Halovivax gelatinilyticus]|uniref:xanthine dehydrogenase family protein molybdopterin-binding subunit n=1 Tax=Halovivax gelatinilyticus TaxID=2961597 RepID=UPI0020CA7F0B|nr:xanthine dehydrogenase family protein molybdopterin-binding subunit [Halovivax gelatinilyticus]
MNERSAAGKRDGDEGNPLVGTGVSRREDRALLTGAATFTDDRSEPDLAHLAFVRSEHAHARLKGVDASAALELDGVLAVYIWGDIADSESPGVIPIASDRLDAEIPGHPVLARDRVRYHGEPIAAVVATDRYAARDGVEAVEVDADPLDAVVDPLEAANHAAPTLYEAAPENVVNTSELGDRDATDETFEAAPHVVDLSLENNRLIPSALEPRAALADWNAGDERLTVEMTSQSPHGHRRKLAQTLDLPERQIRVIAPAVGGGFGHKGHHHPGEAVAAWASMRLERPVAWTATRSENYLAGAHGRDHRTDASMALDSDGRILGIRVETVANVGGYGLGGAPAMPSWYGRLLASQYDVPAIHCETRAVVTNTAPIHSYRGAGRPEAIYVTERLVDIAARELGIDPVEIRRRNLLSPDDFPHETAVGAEYDSGEYEAAIDRALELAGIDAEGDHQLRGGERDDAGRLRGVGLANYVESTGGGYESGLVRVHPDGTVTVFAGSHSHGQGHETTYAQIVADELEVAYDDVDVVEGDTDAIPAGTGTFGSRSTIAAGNAVREGAKDVLEKARRVAAFRLDADLADVAYADGSFTVEREREDERLSADGGAESVSFAEVASAAYGRGLPEPLDPGLEATCFYEPDGTAYTFGTHVAFVAVDPATGDLEIERYVAVDDCGPRVNPTIVEGQIHGGVAQGLGQVCTEETVYDPDGGRLLTDTMFEYGVPRASQLPDVETGATETPSPLNPLGVKGIGEAGTIAAPPAVVNAVCDALAPYGIEHVDMPLTAERLWTAIREATDE